LTEPTLAMAAALVVLVAGVALGVVSAGAASAGRVVSASNLASSHGAILSVPFALLMATSLVEWSAVRRRSEELTTAGIIQVGLLVLGAGALYAGALANNLALVETNVPLALAGIAVFLVRVGAELLQSGAARRGIGWLAACSVFLAVEVGLVAHVVFEIARARYASLAGVPEWLVFLIDHVTFVGIGTAAVFGALAAIANARAERWPGADPAAAVGTAIGMVGMAAGIGAGSWETEAGFGALLGVSLLVATVIAARRIYGLRAGTGNTMSAPGASRPSR
jgi:hypothetical protein